MSKNQLIKDLPIYINGFVVTYLFMGTKCNFIDCIMFGLAMISFFWYGRNQKTKL
jgi:hypothetical protein